MLIYNFKNKEYQWEIKQPWLELEAGNPNVILKKNLEAYDIEDIRIVNALNISDDNPPVLFLNLYRRIKMFTRTNRNRYELNDKDGNYKVKWLNTFFNEIEPSKYSIYDDRRRIMIYMSIDYVGYKEYGVTNNEFDVCSAIYIDFPKQFPDVRGIYYSYPDDMIVIVTGDEYTENTLLDKLKDKPVLIKRI
ncbi:hypothetical protein NO1_0194 [Candidatus Termititenax aidoneus]|uniref:Uncharacterized protein n=1 Tax=Termititenax aidoneus TaxID=2218524 RepID=A0A388T916_TERA1|nr:hypothetical protein NO1_0194 [Candidatus Termititenax aidoneus]